MNFQNQPIDYRIEKTAFFKIKSYVYSSRRSFVEYSSYAHWGVWPLVHITMGRDPATGRRKTAFGILAIGRVAVGVIPVGLLALGLFPIGWIAVGLAGALGQVAVGAIALGQLAVGLYFAIGQLAVGYIAVGQVAIGFYALGQIALGVHPYCVKFKDPVAWAFFRQYLPWLNPPP
jgi:hypothetical protein